MEHWLLVYNPASGGGKRIRAALDGIFKVFQDKNKFLTAYRLDRNSPSTIEQVLDEGNFDGIIACGGDGSVNAIGGMLVRKNSKIPFGVLPNGTCNDFARSLELPSDLIKCAEVLAEGRSKLIDVGLINGKDYVVQEVAGGVFVTVSYSVDNNAKQAFGPLAYYAAGMGELHKIKALPLTIETEEGDVYTSDAYLFLALNGTDAAGMSGLIKNAVMDDGKLDILVFKKSMIFDVADTLIKLVTTADFQDKCVDRIKTRKCKISCTEPMVTTVDGEKGPELPIEIEMLPKALNVLY